jgi:hypothetical protein
MTIIKSSTVVGVFEDRILAEHALDSLHQAGFSDDDIGFVVRDLATADINHVTIQRDTATGAVGGGVVGGLLGAAVALLIPGLGPALAGGILAVTLGGVALGAVAGSFAGALTGFGVPEEEAIYYQNELEIGRTIITVNAPERHQEALEILRRDGAYDASTRVSTQNVPLDNPDTRPDDTYDPDATMKSPAIMQSGEYTPESALHVPEAQSTAYPIASRQYDRSAETNGYEGDTYNSNSPNGTNR